MITLVLSAAAVWRTVVLGDLWAALLWSPVTLLVNLPLLTAVWVYLALQLGWTWWAGNSTDIRRSSLVAP